MTSGELGFDVQHVPEHLPRIAEFALPHQRRRFDQPRVDAVLIDLQDLLGGLQGRVELAAAHLQLRQRQPRHDVIGTKLDRLVELLPGLFELSARRVRPAELEVGHRVFRRSRHHRVQLRDRARYIAFIQQERRGQTLRVVVFRDLP